MIKDFAKRIETIIDFLPPIPVVMSELLRALEDENVDMTALGRIVAKDPSMSMNVLKVANSAFYRLPYKVATVDHAVKMLGMREITMICLACGTYRALMPARNEQTFNSNDFWKHSVATGVIARKICRELRTGDQHTAYFLGLLHDVGKVILDRFAHDIYTIVIQTTFDECISMIEAEKRFIGESHDTIGGFVMDKWKLPEIFADVTRFHHAVTSAPEHSRTAVSVISLADQLARLRYFGFGGDKSGVVLAEIDSFKTIEKSVPEIADLDVFKFVYELETVDDEIVEMEKILTA